MGNITTIQVDKNLKTKLDSLKFHTRETYNELISRLVSGGSPEKSSRESLIETIEVLSDPDMIKGIVKGLSDIEEGKVKSLEQIEKEMNSKNV